MAEERAKEVLSKDKPEPKKSEKKDKKKKKHVHKMHIRRSTNGGYIAEHHFQPPEPDENGVSGPSSEPEEHVLPDKEMLMQHVGEHMGDQEAMEPSTDNERAEGEPPVKPQV